MRVRVTLEYEYGGDEDTVEKIIETERHAFIDGECSIGDCIAMDDKTKLTVEVIPETADAD